MYDMAKKSREAMKGKARRLAGEKDQKVDSSDWSPAEPLNADIKTGMRPISRRAYKSGGKVEGECAPKNLGRKPRKAGGKALAEEKSEAREYAKAKTNRDVKAANEEREGIKHIGGLKSGGRAKKADGGDIRQLNRITDPAQRRRLEQIQNPPSPSKPAPARPKPAAPAMDMSTMDAEQAAAFMRSRKTGGRTARKDGGKIATTLAGQEKIQKEQAAASKPTRAKAQHYKKGGRAEKMMGGPMMDPRMNMVKSKAMEFSGAQGTPYKAGGRTKKLGGGALMGGILPALAMGDMGGKKKDEEGKKAGGRIARKSGGRAKGKTNINIVIATGKQPGQDGMPMMPPGGPMGGPKPGGVPVPMPAGGPPGGAPQAMPIPMPMPAPQQPPMARKAGGRITKVAKSYKDMEAGAGSGEGRLQKTDIAKRDRKDEYQKGEKAFTGLGYPNKVPGATGGRTARKAGGKAYRSYKDMDAGAGSGEGRLEKTEIAKRKK